MQLPGGPQRWLTAFLLLAAGASTLAADGVSAQSSHNRRNLHSGTTDMPRRLTGAQRIRHTFLSCTIKSYYSLSTGAIPQPVSDTGRAINAEGKRS